MQRIVPSRALRSDTPCYHMQAGLDPGLIRANKHLLALETHLRSEVDELFALSERIDQGDLSDGLVVSDEIAIRQARLARLTEAKAVLEARATERDVQEQAEYAAKVQEREERVADRTDAARTCTQAAHTWTA
jgi:hypothetical protein